MQGSTASKTAFGYLALCLIAGCGVARSHDTAAAHGDCPGGNCPLTDARADVGLVDVCAPGQCPKTEPDAQPTLDGSTLCSRPESPTYGCVFGYPAPAGTVVGTVIALSTDAAEPACFAASNVANVLPAPPPSSPDAEWIRVQPQGESGAPFVVGLAPKAVTGMVNIGDSVSVFFEKPADTFGALKVERNGELRAFIGFSEAGPFTILPGISTCEDYCGRYARMTMTAPGIPTSVDLGPGESVAIFGSNSAAITAGYYYVANPGECGPNGFLFAFARGL